MPRQESSKRDSDNFFLPPLVKKKLGKLLINDEEIDEIYNNLSYVFNPEDRNSIWSKSEMSHKIRKSSVNILDRYFIVSKKNPSGDLESEEDDSDLLNSSCERDKPPGNLNRCNMKDDKIEKHNDPHFFHSSIIDKVSKLDNIKESMITDHCLEKVVDTNDHDDPSYSLIGLKEKQKSNDLNSGNLKSHGSNAGQPKNKSLNKEPGIKHLVGTEISSELERSQIGTEPYTKLNSSVSTLNDSSCLVAEESSHESEEIIKSLMQSIGKKLLQPLESDKSTKRKSKQKQHKEFNNADFHSDEDMPNNQDSNLLVKEVSNSHQSTKGNCKGLEISSDKNILSLNENNKERLLSSQFSQENNLDDHRNSTKKRKNTHNEIKSGESYSSANFENKIEEYLSKLVHIKDLKKEANTDLLHYTDITPENDLFIIQCPNEINPNDLIGKYLSLSGASSLSLNTNDRSETYECFTIQLDSPINLLLPNKDLSDVNLGFFPGTGKIILSKTVEAFGHSGVTPDSLQLSEEEDIDFSTSQITPMAESTILPEREKAFLTPQNPDLSQDKWSHCPEVSAGLTTFLSSDGISDSEQGESGNNKTKTNSPRKSRKETRRSGDFGDEKVDSQPPELVPANTNITSPRKSKGKKSLDFEDKIVDSQPPELMPASTNINNFPRKSKEKKSGDSGYKIVDSQPPELEPANTKTGSPRKNKKEKYEDLGDGIVDSGQSEFVSAHIKNDSPRKSNKENLGDLGDGIVDSGQPEFVSSNMKTDSPRDSTKEKDFGDRIVDSQQPQVVSANIKSDSPKKGNKEKLGDFEGGIVDSQQPEFASARTKTDSPRKCKKEKLGGDKTSDFEQELILTSEGLDSQLLKEQIGDGQDNLLSDECLIVNPDSIEVPVKKKKKKRNHKGDKTSDSKQELILTSEGLDSQLLKEQIGDGQDNLLRDECLIMNPDSFEVPVKKKKKKRKHEDADGGITDSQYSEFIPRNFETDSPKGRKKEKLGSGGQDNLLSDECLIVNPDSIEVPVKKKKKKRKHEGDKTSDSKQELILISEGLDSELLKEQIGDGQDNLLCDECLLVNPDSIEVPVKKKKKKRKHKDADDIITDSQYSEFIPREFETDSPKGKKKEKSGSAEQYNFFQESLSSNPASIEVPVNKEKRKNHKGRDNFFQESLSLNPSSIEVPVYKEKRKKHKDNEDRIEDSQYSEFLPKNFETDPPKERKKEKAGSPGQENINFLLDKCLISDSGSVEVLVKKKKKKKKYKGTGDGNDHFQQLQLMTRNIKNVSSEKSKKEMSGSRDDKYVAPCTPNGPVFSPVESARFHNKGKTKNYSNGNHSFYESQFTIETVEKKNMKRKGHKIDYESRNPPFSESQFTIETAKKKNRKRKRHEGNQSFIESQFPAIDRTEMDGKQSLKKKRLEIDC